MPNWCYTKINIIHNDENRLRDLCDKITKWTSGESYSENGFGKTWLGNIVGYSGICDINSVSCRGSILDYCNVSKNTLTINTETAWAPMLKMWLMIIDKYIPGADMLYYAEELGCGILATNDISYKNHYILDVYEGFDEESQWDVSEEYAVDFLQDVLRKNEPDINKLVKYINDNNIGIGVYKYEIVDEYEWD